MNDTTLLSDDHDKNDRQFVTALARGLDILGCFRTGDRFLSNYEIAQRTGLARPTVSRLTYTLTKTGHLLHDEKSGEYRLAAAVLRLGYSVLAATNISERFIADMDLLTSGPNPHVTVALGECTGITAVYLAASRSKQAVSLSMNVGAQLPLFYSSIGRAILAGMTDEERTASLRKGIEEFPDDKERMEQGLKSAVQDYKIYGYCTSFGSWKPEINAIGAPIRSIDGRTIYGINVGGPSFLVKPEELIGYYGPRLLEMVEMLSGR